MSFIPSEGGMALIYVSFVKGGVASISCSEEGVSCLQFYAAVEQKKKKKTEILVIAFIDFPAFTYKMNMLVKLGKMYIFYFMASYRTAEFD